MITSTSFQPPMQLKGELMDLEFTIDNDHRKRRRNRTTQSCLNCHTSKRKCDRKRPCQRCIQLGLATGLCVYEIDDPALRDDPTLDETTRLRNRIAELESLVRELRGKPHPRWADANFRDGDPNEKWHSRASKATPTIKRRAQSPEGIPDDQAQVSLLAPIKTEGVSDIGQSSLYRFSPSPGPSMRYHTFQADVRPSSSAPPYENEHRHSFSTGSSSGSSVPFQPSSSSPSMPYNTVRNSARGSYPGTGNNNGSSGLGGSGNSSNYPGQRCEEDGVYAGQYASDTTHQTFCPRPNNPAIGHALLALTQQLQTTLNALRQYSGQHPPSSQCLLYRRIVELNNLIQYVFNSHLSETLPDLSPPSAADILSRSSGSDGSGGSYEELSNSTESDILSPLSASSSHASFQGSSAGTSGQDWHTIAATTGYNQFYAVPSGDGGNHGIYNNVGT